MIGLDRSPASLPAPAPAPPRSGNTPDPYAWTNARPEHDAPASAPTSPHAPPTPSSAPPPKDTAAAATDHPPINGAPSPAHTHSSLTPAPASSSPRAEPDKDKQADDALEFSAPSRPLTPLTELSPAQTVDEEDEDPEPATSATTEPARTSPKAKANGVLPDAARDAERRKEEGAQEGLQVLTSPAADARDMMKVPSILELNTELVKVCGAFQAQSIPPSDPRYQQYFNRLQSNLSWMAAAADAANRQSDQIQVALPAFDPPPPLEFVSTDRIQQLYADLARLFAKDIARVKAAAQQHAAAQQLQSHPHPQPPVLVHPQQPTMHQRMSSGPTLKRDRSDEVPDGANKRRDTGEHKNPNVHGQMGGMNPGTPVNANVNMHMGMSTMQPPTKPGFPGQQQHPSLGSQQQQMSEQQQQIARTRQMQMRQMMAAQQAQQQQHQAQHHQQQHQQQQHQAQQQQQQQQQQLQAQQQHQRQQQEQQHRQMSPNHPPQGHGGEKGVPAGQGANSYGAVVQALGPQALQYMQMLQDPNNSLVKFMASTVPGFMGMPLQQQLHRMREAHMQMQHRSRQAALQQQQQQQQMPGPSQSRSPAGGAGFAPIDPRTGGPSLTPAQMAQLSAMTPQQRQLVLMQQQSAQLMRGGPASTSFSPQQLAMGMGNVGGGGGGGGMGMQGPRMGVQSPPHQTGSPLVDFVGMRPGSAALPGIARTTRSPSESAPSPMTPRLPQQQQQQQEYHRQLLMQQQQGWQQQHQQQPQQQPMGGGMGGGGGGSNGGGYAAPQGRGSFGSVGGDWQGQQGQSGFGAGFGGVQQQQGQPGQGQFGMDGGGQDPTAGFDGSMEFNDLFNWS